MERDAKYAHPEYERRFLLSEVPSGVVASARIHDRYLTGTRLRLRRVEKLTGELLQLKLGQKRRPDETDPSLVLHTTMYLTEEEHNLLVRLPGVDLTKTRHLVEGGGVDVHEDGTIILEVEFPTREEVDAYEPPEGAVEVTNDEAYTGYGLATASTSD